SYSSGNLQITRLRGYAIIRFRDPPWCPPRTVSPRALADLGNLPAHRLVERRDVARLQFVEACLRGCELLLDHLEDLHLRVGRLVVDAARFVARALAHAAAQPDQVHVDLVSLGEILVVAVDFGARDELVLNGP